MRVLKSVLLCFPKIPEDLSNWKITYGDITIQTRKQITENNQDCLLISAEKLLENLPPKTEDGIISIPIETIKLLEYAIENVSNTISLSQKIRRSISSTSPSIFLVPMSEEDNTFLLDARDFDFNIENRTEPRANLKFDLEFCLKNIGDRFDGVQILAEANANDHLSGKFHEYIRFLERGFNTTNRGLIVPLSNFLIQNPSMEYSKSEVEDWIKARHRSIHANNKEGFFVESDIRPFVPRIEQACYEVLFNKKTWRDKSTIRRRLFTIELGTKGNKGDLFITQGTAVNFSMLVLDETRSYPMNLNAGFNTLPKGWWAPNPKEKITSKGSFAVKPRKQ